MILQVKGKGRIESSSRGVSGSVKEYLGMGFFLRNFLESIFPRKTFFLCAKIRQISKIFYRSLIKNFYGSLIENKRYFTDYIADEKSAIFLKQKIDRKSVV